MYSLSTDGVPHRRFHVVYDESALPLNSSCGNGDLLLEGMRQHEALGKFYRDRYVGSLLPQQFDPTFVALRSSVADRCVRSLISFINGMYPPAFPEEIVDIRTGAEGSLEPLDPAPWGCHDLARDYAAFRNSTEFLSRMERARGVQRPLYDYLALPWDGENWQYLGDWLYSFWCSNQSIPPVVTDDMFRIAMNDTAFAGSGFDRQYVDDSVGSVWRLLLAAIDARLTGNSQVRFTLFSSHDTTLWAILVALGYFNEHPPYRSQLLVELYDDKGGPKLMFSYNGRVLRSAAIISCRSRSSRR
jgi:acid phosphatase